MFSVARTFHKQSREYISSLNKMASSLGIHSLLVYSVDLLHAMTLIVSFEFGCLLVDALHEIAITMGAKYWTFNPIACRIETVGLTEKQPKGSEGNTECDCNFENNTICHVAKLYDS